MFATFIVLIRKYIGQAKFNQVRGRLIALHAQTITQFCNYFGVESSRRQYLIRLARDNGKRLGLLA